MAPVEDNKKEEANPIVKEETKPATPPVPPAEEKKVLPKKRRIVIETDGNNINLAINETAGSLELTAVLQTIIGHINSRK